MQLRQIGKSELSVTPLCLGGNVFGWTIDEARSFEVLDAYVNLGGNFIDTADVYSTWGTGNSGGESETILGRWMKARGNRSQIVLSTKLGGKMGEGKEGLSAAYMAQAVEASLQPRRPPANPKCWRINWRRRENPSPHPLGRK